VHAEVLKARQYMQAEFALETAAAEEAPSTTETVPHPATIVTAEAE